MAISGIVTRRPLVLQLHKTDGGEEYAEFGHIPRRRYTDFCMSNIIYVLHMIEFYFLRE